MKRFAIAIVLAIFACTTVQAARPCNIFDDYNLSYSDEPCITYMDPDEAWNWIYKAAIHVVNGNRAPKPPATMHPEDVELYHEAIDKAYQILNDGQFAPKHEYHEVRHYHQAPRNPYAASSESHYSSSERHNPSSPGLGLYDVPRPYGWDVNEHYIPSWKTQHETELRRWRLERAQQPNKGQSFIDAVPKGDQFRQVWD